MPKVGSKTAAEDRLRQALIALLDKLGALPPDCGKRTDDHLVWLSERVQLNRGEFATCPELDADLPF